MFYFHGNTDHQNHEDAGRGFTPAVMTDQQLARRVGMRHICATCGHVTSHPEPAALRMLAREHADNCGRMVA